MAVKTALAKLKRRGIFVDFVICPVCKSHRVVDLTTHFDILAIFQPAYYCLDCGWFGRIATIMTNRPEDDAVLKDLMRSFPALIERTDDDEV